METTIKRDDEKLGTPTTQRVSGRCIKRPRKDDDTTSPKVCVRRLQQQDVQPVSSPKSTNPEKTRRSWDLWTHESKNWFFDALCEFGKDFDAIYNSMAAKSRKSKTQGEMTFKNKDQVRYFYYRTWHKVSKALGDLGDMKKSVQEIYGLINYSEMRKKIGFKALNPTNAPRLLELVVTGQTTIKAKGKNLRIKTPVCRALRILNNVPDRYNEGPKVPQQISIEMRPIDNATWTHVQSLAHNPRLRITCHPQRKLSSLVEFLEDRWQPIHVKKKSSLLAALEGIETPQELKNSIFQFASAPQKLQLRVYPDRTLKAIEVSFADSYSSADVSLNSYLKKFAQPADAAPAKSHGDSKSSKDLSDNPAKCDTVNHHNNCSSSNTCNSNNNHNGCNNNNNNNNNGCNNHLSNNNTCSSGSSGSSNNNHNNNNNCPINNSAPTTSTTTPATITATTTVTATNNNNNNNNCDTNNLASQRKDQTKKFVPFSAFSKRLDEAVEPSVAALVNEEANDGLASNLTGPTTPVPPPAAAPVEAEKDGPVGSGWTIASLSVMTVGDFYLRLGCPESVVLFYGFEGNEFPAPENRARSVLEKLITVLSAGVCDKKSSLQAQQKLPAAGTAGPQAAAATSATATVAATAATLSGSPASTSASTAGNVSGGLQAKFKRLSDKAEFAVPQGLAPRVTKREVTLDAKKMDLPSGNRRQRMRRKPISAMMVQRPVLPRMDPSSGAVAPQSVPNGVVIRSIMPSKAVEVPHTISAAVAATATTTSSIDFPTVSSMSLEGLIGSAVDDHCLPDVTSTPTAAEAAGALPSVSDRLETPKKVFNFNDEQLPVPSPLPPLDLPPLLPSTPTKQWLNGDASNLSLGALLNSLESPQKSQLPVAGQDSNSNLESKLPDVESHLQSLMNESSLDFMTKFADLAAQIARQPAAGPSVSEDV